MIFWEDEKSQVFSGLPEMPLSELNIFNIFCVHFTGVITKSYSSCKL